MPSRPEPRSETGAPADVAGIPVACRNGLPDQIFSHTNPPDETKFVTISNRGFINKPRGGLWTTPAKSLSWVDYTRGTPGLANNHRRTYHLRPHPRATVAVINSAQDVTKLLAQFEHPLPAQFANAGLPRQLDFEKLSGYVDGIYLTDAGAEDNHYHRTETTLFTWDLESILWLKWCFTPT